MIVTGAMSVFGARQKMQPEDRLSKMLESAGTAIGTGMTGTTTVTPAAPPANETPTQRFVRLTKTPYGFYDILGVDREASQADIRKAYRRIALLHHPDRNPDDQENADAKFKAINEAHETLTDDLQKERYDIFGMQPLS
ncbi:putative chaperone protein [Neofusicoccum parvum]|uniref:Chaperone protein n=1 Tax=Neofusicoccum parvum TaxID=310453 RepID=A0ACB5SF37_9PEZI|nr:putative chaperone protein [Neofusicoccum parvum]